MFKASIPKSSYCDYGDPCIVVQGKVTVEGANANNRTVKKPIE